MTCMRMSAIEVGAVRVARARIGVYHVWVAPRWQGLSAGRTTGRSYHVLGLGGTREVDEPYACVRDYEVPNVNPVTVG
jgi:hypothetical protein